LKKELMEMSFLNMSLRLALLTVFVLQGTFCLAESCPSKDAIQQAATRIFKRDLTIGDIRPSPVPGLCEVQAELQGQYRMIYTDTKGEYLIPGQIYRISDGANLTRDAIAELNRFTDKDLAGLEPLTAFSIGSKGPVVYFVTDPQCPYCGKAEEIFAPMAEAGEVQVRFLLFPLKFHKGAEEESISVICDNKGLEGLKARYRSDNQCEEGKKKVGDTMELLKKKGITGTPTYIFSDGLFQSGVMDARVLKERLQSLK
jgi:thiol:disulfide interchange protein DsbC